MAKGERAKKSHLLCLTVFLPLTCLFSHFADTFHFTISPYFTNICPLLHNLPPPEFLDSSVGPTQTTSLPSFSMCLHNPSPFFYLYIMFQHWQTYSLQREWFPAACWKAAWQSNPSTCSPTPDENTLCFKDETSLADLGIHSRSLTVCQTLTFSQYFTSSSTWTFHVRRLNM